jgi:hypothetical protein
VSFIGANHFLAPRLFVYIAKDNVYPSFSGRIGHFHLLTCDGAYNPNTPPTPEKPELPTPVIPETPKTPTPVEPEKKCIEGSPAIVDAAFNKGALADL